MDCSKQKWQEKGSSGPLASKCLIIEVELLKDVLSTCLSQWELPHGLGGHLMKPKCTVKKERNKSCMTIFFPILVIISTQQT